MKRMKVFLGLAAAVLAAVSAALGQSRPSLSEEAFRAAAMSAPECNGVAVDDAVWWAQNAHLITGATIAHHAATAPAGAWDTPARCAAAAYARATHVVATTPSPGHPVRSAGGTVVVAPGSTVSTLTIHHATGTTPVTVITPPTVTPPPPAPAAAH